MSGAGFYPCASLVAELIEAAEAEDEERLDELLDALRMQADYEAFVDELILSVESRNDAKADRMLEKLRSLPSLASFQVLRSTAN